MTLSTLNLGNYGIVYWGHAGFCINTSVQLFSEPGNSHPYLDVARTGVNGPFLSAFAVRHHKVQLLPYGHQNGTHDLEMFNCVNLWVSE